MLLVGCSKDSTTPEGDNGGKPAEISTDNSLRNFAIKADKNSVVSVNGTGVSGAGIIYLTLKEGTPLESLIPTFKIHDKAVASINGQKIVSDSSAIDFSKTQTITVTAENGQKATYKILVRNGNEKIDKMVYNFMITHDLPGVSVAISKNEQIAYVGSYGFSDKSNGTRVNEHTLFRLASMSKQHAAIAIMELYKRELLDIDDTIFGEGGLLEEEYGNEMGAQWKKITIRDILSHSSGISTDCIFGGLSAYSGKTAKERVRTLLKNNQTPGYTVGQRFSYNNSSFLIAGVIVEHITGKGFMQFLKDEIYTPNGIEEIYGGMNSQAEKRGNECVYYGQDGKNPYGNDVEAGVAAGGVIASTTALMNLMARLDYKPGVEDIFPAEILDLMYTAKAGMKDGSGNVWNRYGLGWRVNYPTTGFSNWAAYHGGTLAGVCTIWARGKNNVNGVVLCNSRSYNQSIDDRMWEMLSDIQNMF